MDVQNPETQDRWLAATLAAKMDGAPVADRCTASHDISAGAPRQGGARLACLPLSAPRGLARQHHGHPVVDALIPTPRYSFARIGAKYREDQTMRSPVSGE